MGYSMDQQYNCYSKDMRHFWTDEKKIWCCANKDIGCPYSCLSRELWTDEKREWCCANKDLGCLATRDAYQQYNCYSRDIKDFWTDEKKEWCCANKDLGCLAAPGPAATSGPAPGPALGPVVSRDAYQQYNCYSRDMRDFWTDEKREWCCANKDLGCLAAPAPAPTSGQR